MPLLSHSKNPLSCIGAIPLSHTAISGKISLFSLRRAPNRKLTHENMDIRIVAADSRLLYDGAQGIQWK